MPLSLICSLALAGMVSAQCNPLQATCPPINGLAASTYQIDFTTQTPTPANWTLADQATVKYGANGAEFTFAKANDAPYIWTSFYVMFAKVEVVLKAAPGQGIISGSVMMSDDLDEIDWEWSGSNFNSSQGKVQTNYFGKGITGNYDRGTQPVLSDDPSQNYHTYTIDWKPESLTWSVDGNMVRTTPNQGQTNGSYQYPQTPSRLHLGLWNAGAQTTDWGVVAWAGGYTDMSKVPYTAYIKSVKITNYNPCSSWQYPANFSGKWQDVQCTNQTVSTPTNSAPAMTAKPTPANLPCNYTVIPGDYGTKIADRLGVPFSDLNITNIPIDWDKIVVGQVLKVPGGNCPNGTIPMPSNMTTTANSSSLSSSMSPSSSSSSISTSISSSNFSSSSTSSSSSSCSTSSSSSSSNFSAQSTPSARSSTDVTAATTGPTACNMTYAVAPGDFGNKIAGMFGIYFNDLSKINPGVNWDDLTIGQQLIIPANAPAKPANGVGSSCNRTAMTNGTTCGLSYTVQKGDYGNSIAAAFGIYFNDLKNANPHCNWDNLKISQNLIIPGKPAKTPPVGVGSSACVATSTGSAMSSASRAVSSLATGSSSSSSSYNPATVVAVGPAPTPSMTTSTGAPASSSSTSSSTTASSAVAISPLPASASGAVSPAAPANSSCGYQIAAGDFGYKIAGKLNCSFDQLNITNPGVDWNKLLIGQTLVVPGSPCATLLSSSTSSSSSSSASSTSSSSTTPSSLSSVVSSLTKTSSLSSMSSSLSTPSMSSFTTSLSSSSSTWTSSSGSSSTTPCSVMSSLSSSSANAASASFTSIAMSTSSSSSSNTSAPSTTPASSSTSYTITVTASSSASTMVCNHDNCLNNLLDPRYTSSAYRFCTSYLSTGVSATQTSTTSATTTMNIPSWLGNCKNDATRVSSACHCLCTAAPSTASFYNIDMKAQATPSSSSTSSSFFASSSSSTASLPTTQQPWVSYASNMFMGPGSQPTQPPTQGNTPGQDQPQGMGNGNGWGQPAPQPSDGHIVSWNHPNAGQPPAAAQFGAGNQWKREAAPAPEQTLAGGENAWAHAAENMQGQVQVEQIREQPDVPQGQPDASLGYNGEATGAAPPAKG